MSLLFARWYFITSFAYRSANHISAICWGKSISNCEIRIWLLCHYVEFSFHIGDFNTHARCYVFQTFDIWCEFINFFQCRKALSVNPWLGVAHTTFRHRVRSNCLSVVSRTLVDAETIDTFRKEDLEVCIVHRSISAGKELEGLSYYYV